MNERLKELMIQADYPAPELALRAHRLAELIIRECAEVIAPMGDWCGGHGEPSMPSTMECAKRLKEHFGVSDES